MGTFNTKTMLHASPLLIPVIAEQLSKEFQAEGYEVVSESLISGGTDVSISKGGMFKSVIGMKTALKISLVPQNGAIKFDASIGLFGRQIVPILLMWYVGWPILLTQTWGLVKQSQLDEKALGIAQNTIENRVQMMQDGDSNGTNKFCTECGTQNIASANFCSGCGKPL